MPAWGQSSGRDKREVRCRRTVPRVLAGSGTGDRKVLDAVARGLAMMRCESEAERPPK